jgi:hypothetical protein
MGLYVYGALLMALGFTTGVIQHSTATMIAALCAAGTAALGEVAKDSYAAWSFPSGVVINAIALLSWALSALAFVLAVASLI